MREADEKAPKGKRAMMGPRRVWFRLRAIFNARPLTTLCQFFPSLPRPRPPRLPLIGDGIFPSLFGVPIGENLRWISTPHLLLRRPELFVHHQHPYSTTALRTPGQHSHHMCLLNMATLMTSSRRSQHVKPHSRELLATEASDRLLNPPTPPSIFQRIS